ncbi:MAG TPA: nucleoside triphosphate pyrophosphatase [Anaerolineae bacterium]|nr:nucleoside triphosphate pyrophosphatase [Anaerolineae bacterium]
MIAHPDHSVKAGILLASASPRRRALIKMLGLPVETTSTDIDEVPLPGERADEMAMRLSLEKARAASSCVLHPSSLPVSSHRARRAAWRILLASDTVVSLDGEPLGKPRDAAEARLMLRRLRGRIHQVYTAITLIDLHTDRSITDLACSDVPMRTYTDEEIEAYIASGDPFDKAGAYAIQHAGFHPVENFSQCFANVMGLPLCHVVRSLRRLGVDVPNDVPALCQAHIDYDCPVFERILTSSA